LISILFHSYEKLICTYDGGDRVNFHLIAQSFAR
jgi:hypothetical protein